MGSAISTRVGCNPYTDRGQYNRIDSTMFLCNKIVGTGGFGKVTSAVFLRDCNWYAIKETKKKNIKNRKAIFNEFEALKRVKHSFVVDLCFAFQDRESYFFILDLKCGGDLRQFLKNGFIFSESMVATYVACISSALDHIHSKRVIHRDIKPENIILDELGFPYLIDFGVAEVQNEDHFGPLISALISGTKQYLAPEVFSKDHIHGPESDFYSLGILAFELLFHQRPFEHSCPKSFVDYLDICYEAKKRSIAAEESAKTESVSTQRVSILEEIHLDSPGSRRSEEVFTTQEDGLSPFPSPSPSFDTSRKLLCLQEALRLGKLDLDNLFGDHWLYPSSTPFPKPVLPFYSPVLGHLSNDCLDLVGGLLHVKPTERLGGRNKSRLQTHPWLKDFIGVEWESLRPGSFTPEFIPGPSDHKQILENEGALNSGFSISENPLFEEDEESVSLGEFYYASI